MIAEDQLQRFTELFGDVDEVDVMIPGSTFTDQISVDDYKGANGVVVDLMNNLIVGDEVVFRMLTPIFTIVYLVATQLRVGNKMKGEAVR